MPCANKTNARAHPAPTVTHLSFFLLGLINNFTFVLFITAAEHLLPGFAGLILICTVLPGFLSRLLFAPIAHRFLYTPRILLVALTSTTCILIVALTPSVSVRLSALAIQAAIGALGEISFLALTAHFPEEVVGMWASGTGGAGIAGAGIYVVARNWYNWSAETTLVVCSVVPLFMIFIYLLVLAPRVGFQMLSSEEQTEHDVQKEEQLHQQDLRDELFTKREYLPRLFFTYMLPLSLVYFAEYTINQGVLGTLTVFRDAKSHQVESTYRGLQFAYQIAVFVSRSSIHLIKLPVLWPLPVLQLVNLVILTLSSLFVWLPNLSVAYIIVVWEGLLGGLTYVNAFYRLRKETPPYLREWALSTTTIGDAAGVSLAAFVSVWLESAIMSFRARA